jgi:1-acyl-sn-glycerol-3-phosphate acyltransferase
MLRGSSVLASFRLTGLILVTLPLVPIQMAALRWSDNWSRRLPRFYHRCCLRLCGVSVQTVGAPAPGRPVVFVANHISYLDIPLLASLAEVVFIAKADIRNWPVAGLLARLQRSVFVARRRTTVGSEGDELRTRLAEGHNLVLFGEGTTGDGNRVLPFRSAFLAVAERRDDAPAPQVQPLTIAYTQLDGMPIGRAFRQTVAWNGAAELAGHAWTLLGLGKIRATVVFHPPLDPAAFASRKALTQECERVIAAALPQLNAGRFEAGRSA